MSLQLPDSDQTYAISQTYLATALNQVSLGFWEVNLAEGNYMACTEQCKRNFGRPAESLFSYEDLLASIVPEDLPPMQNAVFHAINTAEPYFSQYRVKHPDGSLHWIEAQGSVVYEDGTPKKIVGTTLDITKTKNLEILRDELLSVTMHELKTPLSAVKGALQLLERHVKNQGNEQINNIAARALNSADRITRLLSDMSNPFRVQTSEIILDKSLTDLQKLIKEITDNAIMLNSGVTIHIHRSAPLLINIDRYRIGQVISNLVNNAIKYTTQQPQIDIMLDEVDNAVEVRVKDNGIGIPEKDRMKIFQKFYRSPGQLKVDGLGIGLYLCADIILRHGGTINVEDFDEPGTTICFKLPH